MAFLPHQDIGPGLSSKDSHVPFWTQNTWSKAPAQRILTCVSYLRVSVPGEAWDLVRGPQTSVAEPMAVW